jgi:hypothetical protein
MSNGLRKQIYNSLNLKETEELIEIWQTNDRVEWTDVAFEVIQEILQGRLVELPSQDEPVLEHVSVKNNSDELDDEALEKITDKDNSPVFYKPQEVFWLEIWLPRAAIASIVATVVTSLFGLSKLQITILSYFPGGSEWSSAAWLMAIVIFVFIAASQSIVIYFSLKALVSILKILMEMEFNSRGAKEKMPDNMSEYSGKFALI